MPGQIVPVIPPTDFNFDNVAASQEANIFVAERIDISQWSEVVAMVRAHDLTIAQAGATLKVQIVADGYTPEEPDVQFLDTSAFLAEVTFGSTDEAPMFVLDDLTASGTGGLITIAVGGTQAATAGNLNGRLSIDLSVKT